MQAETSQSPLDEEVPSLTILPEKVCFIIVKAREFDAKDEVTEPDPGSNPSDDKDWEVPRTTQTIRWSRNSRP